MFLSRSLLAALTLGFGLTGFAATSRADVVVNFLQNACASGLGCDGSTNLVADATIADVSGGVTITYKIDNSAFAFYQAGNPPVTTFNPNPATVSGTPTIIAGAAVTWQEYPGTYHIIGSTYTDGAGYTPGHNDPFTAFVLNLQGAGITAAAFLDGLLAVDMCKLSSATACSGTGFINGTLAAVPLPPAAILFGTAMAGLGALGMRRRRAPKAAA
jgi:hypothetical protein